MFTKFATTVTAAALAIGACSTAYAQSVKGTVTLASEPQGLAVNYLTNLIYVALPAVSGTTDSLAIVNGQSDTVIKTVTIPKVGHVVAVDIVANVVYVGGSFVDANGVKQSQVAVLNGWTNTVERTIQVSTTAGGGIQGIAVDPVTGNVYVVDASDSAIAVIHRGGTAVNNEIALGGTPSSISVNPLNRQVYVTQTNGTVDIIDAATQAVTGSSTVGSASAGIAANWVTGDVFVAINTFGPSSVAVLDKSGNNLANVAVGETPYGVDVDFITNLAFVANLQGGTVSVINGATNTVSATLAVSGVRVALNPVTEKVYVANQGDSLTVLSER